MTTSALPAGYEQCKECSGTGREVEIEEVYDDTGYEVVAEIPHDYGPCEICGGNGWLAPETPQQAAAREQRERDASIRHHLETATVHGYSHCGWGCPVADDMRREHVRPGGVHDTQCVDRCIGY